jgi:demethylspheroidene O-methyltransferase
MQLPRDGAERLLRAAVALRLVESRGPHLFGLGPHGAALLGNSGALSMVSHHRILYEDLADPVALFRGTGSPTRLSRFWTYARGDDRAGVSDAEAGAYSALMSESQTLVRRDILDAISLQNARLLVDIGGGEGGFAAEALKKWPHLKAVVFDLPAVARRAQARFESLGLGERASAIGGDFYADSLPAGADVFSLVRVLHDHDDSAAQDLLLKIQRSLPLGGRLFVAEPMAGTPGAEAMGDAYFGVYLLAMGSGRPRPAQEIVAMLQAAGFATTRRIGTPRPMLVSLIEATKA